VTKFCYKKIRMILSSDAKQDTKNGTVPAKPGRMEKLIVNVTCLLKTGITEPDEMAVGRERFGKHASTARNT
jgi:hypothetical protein